MVAGGLSGLAAGVAGARLDLAANRVAITEIGLGPALQSAHSRQGDQTMARCRRSGTAGLLGLASLLPWWVAVILAAICYVALHTVSQMPISPPSGMAGALASSYIPDIAAVGQYALSLILIVAAVVSVGKA
jgi:hypothetical protein